MAILVTGGAGYIGSVAVEDLRAQGETVIVIDNLVYGHRNAVDSSVPFYEGNIGDKDLIRKILSEHDIEACMHFSAYAYVGESVEQPQKYYENNFVQTLKLLDVLIENNIKKFIFSSTCATYGEPQYVPIDEKHPQNPVNPYGMTKFMVERVLHGLRRGLRFEICFASLFQRLRRERRLRRRSRSGNASDSAVLFAAQGKRDSISIFGDDYPTPDGTAIRDYIHISDLSQAHLLALEYLQKRRKFRVYKSWETAAVIRSKKSSKPREKLRAEKSKPTIAPRRAGDPSRLVADAEKAREILGWNPQFPEIEKIIESAWKWHEANPNGYD